MLNPNHGNCFAKIGQAAFNPAHFVPGIGPSPDQMLQGRLFFYTNKHRRRLDAPSHCILRSTNRTIQPAAASRELDAHRRQPGTREKLEAMRRCIIAMTIPASGISESRMRTSFDTSKGIAQ